MHGDLSRAHTAGRTASTVTVDELRFMTLVKALQRMFFGVWMEVSSCLASSRADTRFGCALFSCASATAKGAADKVHNSTVSLFTAQR